MRPALLFLSSASRWKARQTADPFTKLAKAEGLKSRAAFKLIQMDKRHRLFRRGDTVVDLGFAPGSWTQVALGRVGVNAGTVVGIDLLPAAAPTGSTAFCGDFLDPAVQDDMRQHLASLPARKKAGKGDKPGTVDVVLSDMLMNTSGIPDRDHFHSISLCEAALEFATQTLRPGGHFVCKFYQGPDDRLLEAKLRRLFENVQREKPEASRKASRESFFVALRRKAATIESGEASDSSKSAPENESPIVD